MSAGTRLIGTGGSSVFWIKYQNPPVRKIEILLRTSLLPRGETPSQKGPRVAATISLDSARSQPFEASPADLQGSFRVR